jgi:beta-galactosidase
MQFLSWDNKSFFVNDKRASLISGEFHYFRVPKKDWRERLLLLKESGANAVATYIPWLIHEPEENNILFDDVPERSLTDFLKLCCELDIMVIARPGPYAYSELVRDGLPIWLADNYPEIVSHGPNGIGKGRKNVSYLHPVFLEKAHKYINAVSDVIRPFLAKNGGCIVSVQADNEISGCQIWFGYMDCNAEGMGFGQENGYYVNFLKEKYGTIELLNERYETEFKAFTEVLPFTNTPRDNTLGGKRFMCDYHSFYKWTLEQYVKVLCGWFYENGLDCDYCTNAGTPNFIPLLRDMPKQNAQHNFLLGVDHYYTLSAAQGIAMSPDKAIKYAFSLDMLDSLGMPPSVLELQSGSLSDYPPVLPDNIEGFYMTHVAYGMKGSNYYIFTGGPNFENTGHTCEIYDYQAPVSATGEIRPLYYVQKRRNEFCHKNDWLLKKSRHYDFQFGFDWEVLQETASGPWSRYSRDGLNLANYSSALQLSLGMSARLFKFRELFDDLDVTKPLLLVCDQRLSKKSQERLVEFVKEGGRLILSPVLPQYDEDFLPCTILKDFLGVESTDFVAGSGTIITQKGFKVYDVAHRYSFKGFGGTVLAFDEGSGLPVIEHKNIGNGQVVLLGTSFNYNQHSQTNMLNVCFDAIACEKRIVTDCYNMMATLYEDGEKAMVFFINNLAGTVTADFKVTANGKTFDLKDISVPGMSVLPIELK